MWYSQSLKPSVQLHVNIPQRLQAWPVLNVSVKQIQNKELEIFIYKFPLACREENDAVSSSKQEHDKD